MTKLRAHLARRIATEVAHVSRSQTIVIKNDRIYAHQLLTLNYTTYDVRRAQDTVHPNSVRRDILVLAAHSTQAPTSSSSHFLYARVLGVFHANMICVGPSPAGRIERKMDFLWIRWYETVPGNIIPSLRFPSVHDKESFGFLDPASVLRACHVVPAFEAGLRHRNRMGESHCAGDGDDWNQYYVGMYAQTTRFREELLTCYRFTDCDLLIRHERGVGIGHYPAHMSHSAISPSGTPYSALTEDTRNAEDTFSSAQQGSNAEEIASQDAAPPIRANIASESLRNRHRTGCVCMRAGQLSDIT